MKFEAAANTRGNINVISGFPGRLGSSLRQAAVAVALAACFGISGCGQTGAASGANASTSKSSLGSQLSPSSSAIAFGNVVVGASTSQLVTLTAAGTKSVTISSVSASGSAFVVSPQSHVALAPGQSLTVSVSFDPKATGSATGELVVASNASNSSMDIALSGDGVPQGSGTHSVTLNWQPSASAVTGYFVFRGPSATTLAQLNASALPSTSYTDNTIGSGQTYVYAVKSIDSSNVLSAFSNYVTVSVPAN